MPRVTYIETDGTEHQVDVEEGVSAMEGALRNGVPGIDGDCGGSAACATCHVFVPPQWLPVTGPANDDHERAMLELSEGAQDNSRLACQIAVTDRLDGLVLHLPDRQF